MNGLTGGQGRDDDELDVDAVNLFWTIVVGCAGLWLLVFLGV